MQIVTMPKIRLLKLRFNQPIEPHEIVLFRGAVGNLMKDDSVLFHQHGEQGLRYLYPLIQYKILSKKAAIICLEEGADAIFQLFSKGELKLRIGNREELFEVEDMSVRNHELQVWKEVFNYTIINWLALNEDNFEKYKGLEDEFSQKEFLENILVGNILSLAKGLNYKVEQIIKVRINAIRRKHSLTLHEVKFVAFDLSFSTNISLPDRIGLGKGASTGYGVIRSYTNNFVDVIWKKN